MSDIIDPSKLKVAELRAELTARSLDPKGNKPVLIERLKEALEKADPEVEEELDEGMPAEDEQKVEQPLAVEADILEEDANNDEKNTGKTAAQPDIGESAEQEDNGESIEKETNGESTEQKEVEAELPEEVEPELPEEDADLSEEQEVKKDDYDDAPVQDICEKHEDKIEDDTKEGYEEEEEGNKVKDKEEEEEDQDEEDKSAVDLIKDDFFNGHTDELQDLEEEAFEIKDEFEVKEEEMEVKEQRDMINEESVEEVEGDNDKSWDHKRGTKRAASPVAEEASLGSDEQQQPAKKPKQESEVRIIAQEEEPFDQSLVVLDWYNSDLSLKIEKSKRLSATPLSDRGFAYMWHGVRATYGFTKGLMFFEVMLESNTDANVEGEDHPFVVRIGWSVDDTSFTLGEEEKSWGYGGTGKASTNLKFKSYGCEYKIGDIVGAYINLDVTPAVMNFTVNGVSQGIAYEIQPEELDGQAIFPHILTKNVQFKVNFGDEESFSQTLEGYTYVGQVPLADRVLGSTGPVNREDCEVIMMVGLPAAGKTTWVKNYCKENKHKKYTVLGTNVLIDKMKILGLSRKRNYHGRWDQLIGNCTKCLNDLLRMAYNRNRNYIIDQTNVYPTAQKRKIRGFLGFNRRAVVICPSDDHIKERTEKREQEEGKDVPDSAVLEMKANYKLPDVGEFFDSVEFIELQKDESQGLVEQYNKEGADANPERYGNNSGPSDWGSMSNRGGRGQGFGGRRDFGERRDNNRNASGGGTGGFRGGWDRDRDRRGGYDRRGGGGGGGGNWNNNRNRDFSSRLGSRDNNRGSNGSAGGYNNNRNNSSNYRGYTNRDNNRGGAGSNRDSSNQTASRYQEDSSYSASSSNNHSTYGTYGYGSQGYQQQPQQAYQQQQGYGSWNTGGYYGQQQSYYSQQQPQTQATTYGNWGQQAQGWGASTGQQPTSNWGSYGQQQQQPTQQSWGQQQGYGSNYNRK